jgi:hypothetical protein
MHIWILAPLPRVAHGALYKPSSVLAKLLTTRVRSTLRIILVVTVCIANPLSEVAKEDAMVLLLR